MIDILFTEPVVNWYLDGSLSFFVHLFAFAAVIECSLNVGADGGIPIFPAPSTEAVSEFAGLM